MHVSWKKEFELGVREIDAQHMELFARLDRLTHAVAAGKGPEEVPATLTFLEDYTLKHFKAEEELQRRLKYPHYQMHLGEHQHFIATLESLRDKLVRVGINDAIVKQISSSLEQWLVTHICNTDRLMAGFIRQNMNREWEEWAKSQF